MTKLHINFFQRRYICDLLNVISFICTSIFPHGERQTSVQVYWIWVSCSANLLLPSLQQRNLKRWHHPIKWCGNFWKVTVNLQFLVCKFLWEFGLKCVTLKLSISFLLPKRVSTQHTRICLGSRDSLCMRHLDHPKQVFFSI